MEKNSKISSPIINKEIFFPKYIKYPFYGVASNLIDKFIVLGYEQKIIEQNFQNGEAENTEKLRALITGATAGKGVITGEKNILSK